MSSPKESRDTKRKSDIDLKGAQAKARKKQNEYTVSEKLDHLKKHEEYTARIENARSDEEKDKATQEYSNYFD